MIFGIFDPIVIASVAIGILVADLIKEAWKILIILKPSKPEILTLH